MTRPPVHPDLCRPALALRVLFTLQAATAALVLLAAPQGQWLALQAVAALGVLLAGLAWQGGLCAAARLLRAGAPARLALAAAWGALCAVLAWAGVAWTVFLGDAGSGSLAGAALSGALAGAAGWQGLAQRQLLMQPAQAQARLAELQSRIRPHFLFNALNAALALVRIDPDRAERVLDDLSALFRQALAESGSSVSLGDEIELARRYLDVEQVRFGDRLRVHWAVDVQTHGARVPPLVLQPLVENAVKHGVEPALDGADVHISARLWQGLVRLEVSNPVPGEPSQPGSGMALANVSERLKLLHDMAAHCEAGVEVAPGGRRFVARITLPLS